MSELKVDEKERNDLEEKRVAELLPEVKTLLKTYAPVQMKVEAGRRNEVSDEVKEAVLKVVKLLKENGVPFLSIDFLHDPVFPTVAVNYEDETDEAGGYVVDECLSDRPYLLIALDEVASEPLGFVADIDLLAKDVAPAG